MKHFSVIFCSVLLIVPLVSSKRIKRQDVAPECSPPDGAPGLCKHQKECPQLNVVREKYPDDGEYNKYLHLSNEYCSQQPEIYCCPSYDKVEVSDLIQVSPPRPPRREPVQTSEARLLTVEEGCGQSTIVHKKIVGGLPAKPGAYPWLALLGFQRKRSIDLKCAGSLITKRHLVTAAHCIAYEWPLVLVRLGEHDVTTTTEIQHLDVKVSRTIIHPSFNTTHNQTKDNDIAIVVLAEDVQWRKNIRPICIPDQSLSVASLVGNTPFVAGWGYTLEGQNTATVLLEAQIPIQENAVCRDRFLALNKSFTKDYDRIVCTGDVEGGKDACQGDSGGPLMQPLRHDFTFSWTLLGVVSYGIGCGRNPSVYTNVPYYSDWIKKVVSQPL